MEWWQLTLSIALGLLLLWVGLVVVLRVEQRRHAAPASLIELLRLAPAIRDYIPPLAELLPPLLSSACSSATQASIPHFTLAT
jgi:hypothetical protein